MKQNRYLSDAEFLEIAVGLASTGWEDRYPSSAAFVSANPKCCKVTRAPRRKDWESPLERDRTDEIDSMLWHFGWSEYVVVVQMTYPIPNTNQSMNETYWFSACGDFLSKHGYQQKRM